MTTEPKKTVDIPNTLIFVNVEKLSDGSHVYNVSLGEHVWHATSKDDADELATKMAEVINDHTVDTADTVGVG